ncbi:hypothetical protein SAMN05880566_1453 [Janthinobacterium sp. TND4EL3]|uniref:plasmid-related transcriptional repressor protein n=1 Tax=Janthinobacterium sp. TND4EL3 TaxID=1907311 RepID=UPI00095741E2|nr:plasmid-related transcriptional repressor protein [Janthinobacterium sp. TND4EL3]SIR91796.1 hypothetical protein SAMN05880566_1453 [Janthinobacterium sp. TND4EL3]
MADEKDNAPRRKTLADMLEMTKQRVVTGNEATEQKVAETPRQMFLPGFDIGAFPNHLNRSSFIAPIARGRRRFHRQTEMVTRKDCVLEYTGEQLDEADGDIIMALIAFAQPYPIGTPVPLNRAELLRKIKRSTGKHDYEWLHRRIKSLTEATMFLEARKPDGSTRYSIGKTVSFRIITEFSYDDVDEAYSYKLDPRWVQMFGNREYSLIDWDKRMQIGRGQDMAKTLQRLLATSADLVQRYALDWLKDKMEYAGRIRDFRDAVTRAVHELERLEIIAKGCIEDSTKGKPQLVLWLQPSV